MATLKGLKIKASKGGVEVLRKKKGGEPLWKIGN
jgi:hypothetical protein